MADGSAHGYYLKDTKSGSDVTIANFTGFNFGGSLLLNKTNGSGVKNGVTFEAYEGLVGINSNTVNGVTLYVSGNGKFTSTVMAQDFILDGTLDVDEGKDRAEAEAEYVGRIDRLEEEIRILKAQVRQLLNK
jgi:hypothetical protein